jgi:hypothetical protein
MNPRALFLLWPAISPLSAQTWELGLFAGQQTYNSFSDSNVGLSMSGSSTRKSVLGARLGYSVIDLGSAMLQLTLGYQPKVTSIARITTRGTDLQASGETTDSGPLDYKVSSTSAGVMFNFKTRVAIGAGLEMHFERLSLPANTATLARPWFRANFGMAFPSPVLKPFIGLEIAAAMFPENDLPQTTKSLSPRAQVGVYGGIRF